MKKIQWLGDERIIPGFALATKDSVIELPDAMADSFIEQGKAVEYKERKAKKEVN